MIDTILFDLDGTLIDSNQLIIDSFKAVFDKEYPNLEVSETEYVSFIGPTLWESFGKYENDPVKIDALVALYKLYNKNKHDEAIKPFPNAVKLLKTLKLKGYKVGIASSKMHEVVKQGLRISGLLDFVDVVVGMDDVTSHKPNPEALLKALELLGGHKAIYIGDHPNDIKAGKNANMITIGVGYTWHLDKLKESNPDYLINDLMEVLNYV
ncbi:MAG: HAD-IA family hydrolase [Acholeplasmataceae bacterium]|nr:HAD-IA family hydrolase [Acholeplasmataceae bacterium]